jgi:DNA-binding GntR family transcriptional regulator
MPFSVLFSFARDEMPDDHTNLHSMSSSTSPLVPADSESPAAIAGLRVPRVAAPLRAQVLEVLRQAILDFRYEPGRRLIERELVEETGVSRTTIREVLRELESEGLVTSIPQRGAVVAIPSPTEAAELYEVRSVLEQLAVRKFVANASDEEVERLAATVDRFREVVESGGDTLALLNAKDEFYDVLLGGRWNTIVRATLDRLQARVRMLRAASMSAATRGPEIVEELEALVRAVRNRDPHGAAAKCDQHLAAAARSGLEAISTHLPAD